MAVKNVNVGDKIAVTGYVDNAYPPAIGDTGKVTSVQRTGSFTSATIKLDNGRTVKIENRYFPSLTKIG